MAVIRHSDLTETVPQRHVRRGADRRILQGAVCRPLPLDRLGPHESCTCRRETHGAGLAWQFPETSQLPNRRRSGSLRIAQNACFGGCSLSRWTTFDQIPYFPAAGSCRMGGWWTGDPLLFQWFDSFWRREALAPM